MTFPKPNVGQCCRRRAKPASRYIDNDVLEHFRVISEKTGPGYQTLINEALKTQVGRTERVLTPEMVRRIVREELALQS